MELLTNRDREYLRVLYMLKGSSTPVGPVKLSKKIGVTKVCAFQKMRRLEALGYGEYIVRQGLKLNNKAKKVVEQDVKRHHIIEAFLERKLGLAEAETGVSPPAQTVLGGIGQAESKKQEFQGTLRIIGAPPRSEMDVQKGGGVNIDMDSGFQPAGATF